MVEGTTKNHTSRRIALSSDALNIFRLVYSIRDEYLEADDFIVLTNRGTPYTTTNMEHRAAVIYKHAGIFENKYGVHILRRTFATNLYNKGVPIKTIAAYLGDLPSTVERYYISARTKKIWNGEVIQVVELPKNNTEEAG